MNGEGRAAPESPRANGYSARSIVLRLLAAAAVVAIAVLVRDLYEDETASDTGGSRVISFEVESEALDGKQPVEVVIPPGARDGKRALLVFLHGRGEDESSYLVDPMFKALRRQRGKAPVVAFPRGGPDSYWHDREDGDWGTYVLDELTPALIDRFEIEPERVAIGGISMGGFGAYNLARLQPEEFCSVGAHSPAVWENASDTAPGAFDGEEDFERNDVIAEVGPPLNPLEGKRTWIDVGNDDPFQEAGRALADSLEAGGAEVIFYEGDGGHETSYWDSNWPRYMAFYARTLKACQAEPPKKDGDEGGKKDEETAVQPE
jgi:S-formylglutathione hydrolase FrmB